MAKTPVGWIQVASPSAVFSKPVWFGARQHVHADQPAGMPVMLIDSADFSRLLANELPHAGAFGSDYADDMTVTMLPGRWVAVWKFPWAL